MPTCNSNKRPPRAVNKWHTCNVKRIKTMIRDFSLVFLLLISDRRNLHRDAILNKMLPLCVTGATREHCRRRHDSIRREPEARI